MNDSGHEMSMLVQHSLISQRVGMHAGLAASGMVRSPPGNGVAAGVSTVDAAAADTANAEEESVLGGRPDWVGHLAIPSGSNCFSRNYLRGTYSWSRRTGFYYSKVQQRKKFSVREVDRNNTGKFTKAAIAS